MRLRSVNLAIKPCSPMKAQVLRGFGIPRTKPNAK
jgi:hypothetical protein